MLAGCNLRSNPEARPGPQLPTGHLQWLCTQSRHHTHTPTRANGYSIPALLQEHLSNHCCFFGIVLVTFCARTISPFANISFVSFGFSLYMQSNAYILIIKFDVRISGNRLSGAHATYNPFISLDLYRLLPHLCHSSPLLPINSKRRNESYDLWTVRKRLISSFTKVRPSTLILQAYGRKQSLKHCFVHQVAPPAQLCKYSTWSTATLLSMPAAVFANLVELLVSHTLPRAR